MNYELSCHPDTPTAKILGVSVQINANDRECWLEFYVRYEGKIALPAMGEPRRADGLWKRTCFEVFLKSMGDGPYVEFNLSPSFEWAAYSFDSYRSGMRELALEFAPEISITPDTPGHFWLAAELDISAIGVRKAAMNLTAVIEDDEGGKSYWALAHAPGAPDFHNPDCFVARLPAPERP